MILIVPLSLNKPGLFIQFGSSSVQTEPTTLPPNSATRQLSPLRVPKSSVYTRSSGCSTMSLAGGSIPSGTKIGSIEKILQQAGLALADIPNDILTALVACHKRNIFHRAILTFFTSFLTETNDSYNKTKIYL